MAGIDENLTFYPLRIAVLTVSDSRDEQSDKSGALLAQRLQLAGHELAHKMIVKDDVEAIQQQVKAWSDNPQIDVIISTGGTGFAPRDVTPEQSGRCSGGRWTAFPCCSTRQAGHGRPVDAAVSRLCRADKRHLYVLPPGLDRCLPGWVGSGPVQGTR